MAKKKAARKVRKAKKAKIARAKSKAKVKKTKAKKSKSKAKRTPLRSTAKQGLARRARSKKRTAKPAAAKSPAAKKGGVKPKKASVKPAVPATAPAASAAQLAPPSVPFNWEIRDLEVRYSNFDTHFQYTRINPEDGDVRIFHATAMGGEPIEEMPQEQVKLRDSGRADVAGIPRTWWANRLIFVDYKVAVELWKDGYRKARKEAVVMPG